MTRTGRTEPWHTRENAHCGAQISSSTGNSTKPHFPLQRCQKHKSARFVSYRVLEMPQNSSRGKLSRLAFPDSPMLTNKAVSATTKPRRTRAKSDLRNPGWLNLLTSGGTNRNYRHWKNRMRDQIAIRKSLKELNLSNAMLLKNVGNHRAKTWWRKGIESACKHVSRVWEGSLKWTAT